MRWEQLTTAHFPAAVEQAHGVCLLPLGVIEPHGGHLPLIADLSAPREVAIRAAAREKAQQTTCLSNLKQMSLGTVMYASDWDETFATIGQWSYFPDTYGWLGFLEPYLKNLQILHCPMKSGTGVNYAVNGGRSYSAHHFDTVFGLVGWWDPPFWWTYGAGTGEIDCPVSVITCFEEARGGGSGIQQGDIGAGWYGLYFGQYQGDGTYTPPLHNDGQNFGFADGHAKWVSCVGHPCWDSPNGYPVDPETPRTVSTWEEREISFWVHYCPGEPLTYD